MKTKYEHIEFRPALYEIDGHESWECVNIKHGDSLGIVSYYYGWKQYVFSATDQKMIFSVSCLQDIIHFIEQLK